MVPFTIRRYNKIPSVRSPDTKSLEIAGTVVGKSRVLLVIKIG